MKPETRNHPAPEEEMEPDAGAVARYLSRHPDFFEARDELLEGMSLTHESGRAISLLERQVALLRGRVGELEGRLRGFVANAKRNDGLFEKTRLVILKLLDAGSLAELSAILEREIGTSFDTAQSTLLFISDESDESEGLNWRGYAEAQEIFGTPFERKRTFCAEVDAGRASLLFPESPVPVASMAVVPIHASPNGSSAIPVLVIGSSRPGHFTRGQDTLFLDFIGEVLATLIPRLG